MNAILNWLASLPMAVLQQATAAAQALGQPRVGALHLPPPETDGSQRGEFAALEVAAADGPPGLARTLGWGAAQALVDAWVRRSGWAPPPAADSLAGLAPRPGEHIGMVGLFGPLVQRLVASGARITVLELRADWAGTQAGCEVTLDPQALRHCSRVLVTGTVLLNDTFEQVLAHTRAASHRALVGPSVGLWAGPLLGQGLHLLGGTWVTHPEAFVEALRCGRERGSSARKFSLCAADVPVDGEVAVALGCTPRISRAEGPA